MSLVQKENTTLNFRVMSRVGAMDDITSGLASSAVRVYGFNFLLTNLSDVYKQ